MPHLEQIQRWMQAVITHPAGVGAGLASADARGHLDVAAEAVESVVSRSAALDSVGRLEVYANAYYARLLECLREEFPALTACVGAEAFDELAFGYLREYPSASYTLNHLADRFPQYLAQSRPEREPADGQPDWADLLVDLAALELHFSQVFDGPGIEKTPLLSAEALRAIAPDDWPAARLVAAPCLRVVELRFPLDAYYTALRRGQPATLPQAAPSWMAITRRDFVVRRHVVSRTQAILLQALLRGETIGDAIGQAAEVVEDLESFAPQLGTWFQAWSRAGFFVRVEVPVV